MGRLPRSRPWPILRDGALILRLPHPSRRAAFGRAPQDEADRRTRLPQHEDERVGWPVCCKQQRIYKAPLMQTPDAFRPPGAIPTVDFLLAHFRAFAKRVPVKSLVAA